MPIFEYECSACLRVAQQSCASWREDPWRGRQPICDVCQEGVMERKISAPMVHFKGEGWTGKHYKTSDDAPPYDEVVSYKKERGGRTVGE